MNLYISNFIATDTYNKLLLGSEDPEIRQTLSPFVKQYVDLKAYHISDTLYIVVESWKNKRAITWIKCYDIFTLKLQNGKKNVHFCRCLSRALLLLL